MMGYRKGMSVNLTQYRLDSRSEMARTTQQYLPFLTKKQNQSVHILDRYTLQLLHPMKIILSTNQANHANQKRRYKNISL